MKARNKITYNQRTKNLLRNLKKHKVPSSFLNTNTLHHFLDHNINSFEDLSMYDEVTFNSLITGITNRNINIKTDIDVIKLKKIIKKYKSNEEDDNKVKDLMKEITSLKKQLADSTKHKNDALKKLTDLNNKKTTKQDKGNRTCFKVNVPTSDESKKQNIEVCAKAEGTVEAWSKNIGKSGNKVITGNTLEFTNNAS